MFDDDSRLTGPGSWILVAVSSFVAFVTVRFTLDGTLSLLDSFLFAPSVGLAVPLGLAFGLPAAVGLAAGAVLVQGVYAGTAVFGLFEGASVLTIALVSARAWRTTLVVPGVPRQHISGAPGFAVVSLLGSVGGAAVLAWGGEFLGLFSFFTLFVDAALTSLVATATVGAALAAVLARTSNLTGRPAGVRPLGVGFVAVPLVWGLLGVVGSLGFSIRQRIPQSAFEVRNLELLYQVVHPDIFGAGGRRAQVAFGAVMLVAWIYTFRRSKLSKPPAPEPQPDSRPATVSSRSEEVEA